MQYAGHDGLQNVVPSLPSTEKLLVLQVWHSQDPVNASFPSRFYAPKPRRHRFFG